MFQTVKGWAKSAWNKTCQAVSDVKAAVVGGVAGLLGLGAGSQDANAALDPNIATGLTALQTDFNSLMALVYPVAISITVALVIFGLVKMFIHRSAR